jgi:hypothetical protein
LTEINTTVVALAKSEGKNEVVLTLELSPKDVVYYSTANWMQAIGSFSHDLSVSEVTFDSEINRLRITLAYNENLQG